MAQAPTATTGAATGVGSTNATLNGTVNANGSSTTVIFEYGLDTSYGFTWTADQSPVTGSTNTAVTATISELLPNTLYHFRVVATNANGTTNGADMTFTTLWPPPPVLTLPATAVGTTTATLNGTVHSQGISTAVSFEWGTDTSYGNTIPGTPSPISFNSPTPVSAGLTTLSNNTTYHFRVVATNANGTSYGNDMTFTTGAGAAPTATTNAATGIGSTTATLNGTVNANNASTIVTFEYGLDTSYGSTALAIQNPVSGSTDTAVSVTINDLLPNTTYHYRVSATNANGSANGADMTFTTLPQAPTATTNAASPVGTTTTTLNGTVNANGASTTVTFQYGLSTSYGTTITAAQSPVTGSTNTAVSRAITGLTNGITYHYRVVASNAGGTTYGADMTFTTGSTAPTAITNAASGIGTTSATLNGTVNANNSSTTVTFEYGLTTAYSRTVTAVQSPVTGSTDTAVNATPNDLMPGTTYHYRVKAVNTNGTTYGGDMTFTTLAAPTVFTIAASSVTTTVATLNGTVNANGSSTTVTFEYGTTPSYGTTVPADQSPVTGSTPTAVSKAITGLTPNTTYHYRAVGQNANGTTYGADMTFYTSAPAAPTAVTDPASFVLTNGATLNGTVNANNASTVVTFEWGPTSGAPYANTVPAVPSPFAGTTNTPVRAVITGLTVSTPYYYRVVAVNANGTAYGAEMSFTTTTAPSAVTNAASAVSSTTATLNGTVNPNTSTGSVTVFFQYGLTTTYTNTATANQSPLTGTTNTAVSATIIGLTSNTTYHYRVVAMNLTDITYGADMTFTTPAIEPPPTATTNAATSVGTNSATLNGTVNANNTTTAVTFEYGETTSYGRTLTADQSPVTGSTDTAVTTSPSDLSPNTTYHFRVVAHNTDNTVYGADMTFTTGGLPPTADTNTATAVTSTGATLNGTVNANNDSTTVTFQYGLTTAYGTTVPADQSPVTGTTNTAVSRAITGLTNNTTYHYRVVAQNSSGTTYGADMTFFTGTAAPSVTTGTASSIGTTSATLNGTVNANNGSTTVTFEYGETTGYGRTVTADQSPVTGSIDTAVSVHVADLNPNTTYHFRAVGQNAAGTTYGADMTFTTNAANTPTVTTANVTNIAATSATSGGNVTDEGGAPVTARGVCWSTTPNPTTADNLTVDGSGAGTFTSTLTGLSPLTTYYVRAYATNLYGTVYGQEIQFTSNGIHTPTVNTVNVTHITANSARSGGNVTDNGGSPVTARGVCWSTAPNPTTANNRTLNGTGTGAFTSYLTNLNPATTYYVRAYATNSSGTAYGGQRQFTTSSAVVSVSITEPGQGEVVSGTVTIAASASVSSTSTNQTTALSIAKVEFYIDDSLIEQDTTQPYETQWDTTTVSDGSHTIKAVAYDQDDNSAQDEISVTVSNGPMGPVEIILNRTSLNFGSVGGSVTTRPQTLLINTSGGGTLNWAITKDAGWLTCSPDSGVGPGVVSVSVNPSGMAAGSYSATITVTDLNTSNGKTLPVYLAIYNQGTTSGPFGVFATPINNSTVMSSIPVTGWVLDDIETTNVAIYRDPVPGEGSGLIYIGDAVFVDGARPDVEQAYPDEPLNYQAGWGYMLLTNFLPYGGNGTFTLYAKAIDKEGHGVTLGSKTIICDNANAVKPFGTIDTPAQGGNASGASYINYGWALTPQPNTIPFDGSTITVWVDGVPLGHPVYNLYRADIATLFPDYNNSSGAVGYFYLDTTTYINGVHTIAWSVKDNAGNSDGIGSRFFTIINTGTSKAHTAANSTFTNITNIIDYIPVQFMAPPMVRKGFNKEGAFHELLPDTNGISTCTIKEVEQIDIQLDRNNSFIHIQGYLEVYGELRSLPIGSTLDHKTGRFSWTPGPGFVGKYMLVFVMKDPGGQYYKNTVEITIEPKFKMIE
jgi:phosphodiesterase/alkaline phosphatase D-like protein